VYYGKNYEYRETNNAVNETEGQVLMYRGQPVSGYYFKNSGGYTQNSEDVWNDWNGYLRSVKDIYSPEYPWSWSASFRDIRNAVTDAGTDPGEISRISITKRNQNGSVGEMKVNGSKGSVTLSKEEIRTLLGYTNIKSMNFGFDKSAPVKNNTITGTGDAAGGKTSGVQELYAVSSDTTVKLSGNLNVLSAEGKITKTKLSEISVLSANSSSSELAEDGNSSGFAEDISDNENYSQKETPEETINTSPVVFYGYGYGHGVGMPQDSAIEMAKQGFDYVSILEYFFADIQISNI
jgi:stage II sporulation protein D